MAVLTRKGKIADRADAVLAGFGKEALDGANFHVAEENGQVVGAASGHAPHAGDTAILGEFRFRAGTVLTRANLAGFRSLLKAHVEEAISLGFTYGESSVTDRAVVRLVERTFGIKAEVVGTIDGKPAEWRFAVNLADFLVVLS